MMRFSAVKRIPMYVGLPNFLPKSSKFVDLTLFTLFRIFRLAIHFDKTLYNWLKIIHLLFSFGLLNLNNLEDIKQKLNIASFLCTVLYLTKNSVHNSNKSLKKKKKQTFHLPSTWKPKSLTSLKRAELSLAVQKCLDTREGLKIRCHGKVSGDS